MKPTDWDEAYKRLNKADSMPPDAGDNLWPTILLDGAILGLLLGSITFLVRWAIS